jgi:hypothetical protein
MCFYEQYRFICGDWKWGDWHHHCNKEYRMGESCGMKLVYQTAQQPTKCKYCEKIDTKLRKRQAEVDHITHYQRNGKNSSAIEKSMNTIKQLDYEIEQLYADISNRRLALGSQTDRLGGLVAYV